MAENKSEPKQEIRPNDPEKYELTDDPECIDQLIEALLLREQCIKNGERLVAFDKKKLPSVAEKAR